MNKSNNLFLTLLLGVPFSLMIYATVVDYAIRFVSSSRKSKENLKSSGSSSNDDDKEESDESDYKDKAQLDAKQEDETGEITITTNII